MIASAAAWTTQGLVRMQDDRDRFAVRFTHLVCPGRSRRSPIRAVARERRCRCPPESRRTIVRRRHSARRCRAAAWDPRVVVVGSEEPEQLQRSQAGVKPTLLEHDADAGPQSGASGHGSRPSTRIVRYRLGDSPRVSRRSWSFPHRWPSSPDTSRTRHRTSGSQLHA